MNVSISGGALQGEISAVPSKSAAHRALICAALADKPTEIFLPISNADIDATASCLRAMGAEITRNGAFLNVSQITQTPDFAELDCGESGSTLRFLLPIAAAKLPKASFLGSGRLPQRPISELKNAMEKGGASFSADKLPLTVSGGLNAGRFEIEGNVSSQYISGLLMALPVLNGDSSIILKSPLCSEPYVNITLEMLKNFGVDIERREGGFFVRGGQVFNAPRVINVEGDWSAAAFFLTSGAIGGDVTVTNLDLNSEQGDREIAEILQEFGADIEILDSSVRVRKAKLTACDIDVSDIPDLLPILTVLASCAYGKTVLYNAANLRHKESDRLFSSATMINALGGVAEEYPDRLEITGTGLRGGTIDSFGDHRIAMSAAIAASACSGQTTIVGAEAVKKSYPDFFRDFEKLGGKIITNEGGVTHES
ncbi:MAG: 3-phosphoshikimate 1-carboxyvinyltransferase [Clostridia bacterium]|nr:3-phosphoshikimate 1-carboxyvinyltransferase [Clostridia bacterium]